MEVFLPRGYEYQLVTFTLSKQSDDGELIGLRNSNWILNTIVYKTVFSGGEVVEVYTNRMDGSILNWYDVDGNKLIF